MGPRSPVLLSAPSVREVGYVSPTAVMQTAPTYVNTYRAPVQQMPYVQTSNMREIDEVLHTSSLACARRTSCSRVSVWYLCSAGENICPPRPGGHQLREPICVPSHHRRAGEKVAPLPRSSLCCRSKSSK